MSKNTQPLEQSLSRLAEIVGALEAHNLALAQAMKLYQEGAELVALCRAELETAEQRITELRERADGQVEEKDMEL